MTAQARSTSAYPVAVDTLTTDTRKTAALASLACSAKDIPALFFETLQMVMWRLRCRSHRLNRIATAPTRSGTRFMARSLPLNAAYVFPLATGKVPCAGHARFVHCASVENVESTLSTADLRLSLRGTTTALQEQVRLAKPAVTETPTRSFMLESV